MSRKFYVAVIVGLVASFFSAGESSGAVVSPRNPYRSFNISGINYASMQWEKQHRKSTRGQTQYRFRNRW
jgi:hypothetical protein